MRSLLQHYPQRSVLYNSRQRTRAVAMAAKCARSQALEEAPTCWVSASRWRDTLLDAPPEPATPIHPVRAFEAEDLSRHGPLAASLAQISKPAYSGKEGEVLLVPGANGSLAFVLLGMGQGEGPQPSDLWSFAALPGKLPQGIYTISVPADSAVTYDMDQACLGWALGCYTFDRYKSKTDAEGKPTPPKVQAKLVWPQEADRVTAGAIADAIFWARDLINTPAEDLGPGHMCEEAAAMAASHGASCRIIRGDALLDEGYPSIHTVGRACSRPPALIDIRWAPPAGTGSALPLPRLSLVGKGVCFDSGGLDLKTAAGMKFMKRDMGGAALVLALGHIIMKTQLPVQLRIMAPTVENSVSGNAYRPLDVLRTRSGITVENGNTDAEGRLILCDALYEASTEQPDILLDAATLTGAARVALGPDIPAVYTNDDNTWQQMYAASCQQNDSLWRLPLPPQYKKFLDSKIADLSSTGSEGAPGSIIAALYLQEFVKKAPRWVHIDMGAAIVGVNSGPGRPEGGEPCGLRAVWHWLHTRYTIPQ